MGVTAGKRAIVTALLAILWSACIFYFAWIKGGWVFGYIGLPGSIVDLLIEGFHGGDSFFSIVVGRTLEILVNSIVFYFVFRALLPKQWNFSGSKPPL